MNKNKSIISHAKNKIFLLYPIFLLFLYLFIKLNIITSFRINLIPLFFILLFIMIIGIFFVRKNIFSYFSKMKISQFLSLYSILILSIYLLFLYHGSKLTGRFMIIGMYMQDIFRYPSIDFRSFMSVISTIFSLLDINITPLSLGYISRIFGILLIGLVFIFTYELFKKISLSLFVSLILLFSNYFISSSISIESHIISLFFIILSFYCLYISLPKEKEISINRKYYFLFIIFFLISCFFRTENIMFFTLPLILYLLIISKYMKGLFIQNFIFVFVLCLSSIYQMINYFVTAFNDSTLRGDMVNDSNILTFPIKIFINNIFTKHQINISEVTIFFFISLLTFLLLLYFIISKFKKGNLTRLYPNEGFILFFSSLWIFYVILLLSFKTQGIGEIKFITTFFVFELIISGYFFSKLIEVLSSILNKYKLKYFDFIISILFFLIVIIILFYTSEKIFTPNIYEDTYSKEYHQIMSKIEPDLNCYFLEFNNFKSTNEYYIIDDFFGIKSKKILFDNLSQNELGMKNECYYTFKGYISEDEQQRFGLIPIESIKNYFREKNCSEKIELNESFMSQNIYLFRFDCA